MAKSTIVANPVVFNPEAYKGLKDEKGFIAEAVKLGTAAVSTESVFGSLAEMAVRFGEIDKANGLNAPRSFAPVLVAFREKYGAHEGRKPYEASTLGPMTTAYGHFVMAGYKGALEAASYAAVNFKGPFTSRGSRLGKLLAKPCAGPVPTTAEAKAFDDEIKVSAATVSKALAVLLRAFDKVEKDHAATLKAQPSNRAKFLVARSNVAALIAMVRDDTDGVSAEDELAEIQRKLAAPASNGVAA